MGDVKFLIQHYIGEIWQRRWSILISAWLFALIGIGLAAKQPDTYEARAQVFVNLRALLRDLLNDEAYIGNPIEDVENVRRLMYARPNIRDIIHRTDLHLTVDTPAQEEALVNTVAENISFTRKNRNHFFISYVNKDPEKARAVVQAMLDLFLEESYSRAGHGTETDEALTLAERDFREYEAKLLEINAQIAEFERLNPEALNNQGSVLSEKRRIETTIAQLRSEETFRDGEIRRLRTELASTPREIVTRIIPGRVIRDQSARPPIPPSEQRLPIPTYQAPPEEQQFQQAQARADQLQAEVQNLLRQYTPNYPGVRERQALADQAQATADSLSQAAQAARQRIQNELARIQAHNQRVDQIQADYQRRLFEYQNRPIQETRTPDEEVYGPNPRREELQSQIGSLESRITVSRQALQSAQSELYDIQEILDKQPLILQRYSTLTTQRGDLESRYRNIESRIDQLKATVRASETELVRFEVIESPTRPEKPIAPNRLALLSGAGLAALALAFGQALLRIQLADNLPSTTHLRQAFDLPVLGSISKLESTQTILRRFVSTLIWIAGFIALILFILGMIYIYHIKGARPDLFGALSNFKAPIQR